MSIPLDEMMKRRLREDVAPNGFIRYCRVGEAAWYGQLQKDLFDNHIEWWHYAEFPRPYLQIFIRPGNIARVNMLVQQLPVVYQEQTYVVSQRVGPIRRWLQNREPILAQRSIFEPSVTCPICGYPEAEETPSSPIQEYPSGRLVKVWRCPKCNHRWSET